MIPMASPSCSCRIGGTIATKATTSDLIRLRLSSVMIWCCSSSYTSQTQLMWLESAFQFCLTKFLKKSAAAWRTGSGTWGVAIRLSRFVRKSGCVLAAFFKFNSAEKSANDTYVYIYVRMIRTTHLLLRRVGLASARGHGRGRTKQPSFQQNSLSAYRTRFKTKPKSGWSHRSIL